ncbi:MAG TPA: DegT/DnrJ/EryC1/StrS aminotransferase family protein, partial [Phenylobacterium sp.]|nr:DegT/DnrJ/EryC1/StrS aminotransferase family protein [Phenylobacterium sp.]
MSIPFIDLGAQRRRLGEPLEQAILQVVRSGAYVLGPQVAEFEGKLAEFGRARHALGCANGTDALILALMALGAGPGDAVFCPSFTFAATGEAPILVGATPVFVDILPETYNLDPAHLDAAISAVKAKGELVPKAVIAVDLFGQPADYPAIAEVTKKHGLKLISDSAQGFGCSLMGEQPLHWADVTTTSFFPAKPLGCYGDGGAVLTDDPALYELLDSLHVHGKATASDLAGRTFDHEAKYLNIRVGLNSRLDTIQAAVLLEKLKVFEEEIMLRQAVADRYADGLSDVVATPKVIH